MRGTCRVPATPSNNAPTDDGWSFATRQLHPPKVYDDPYAALSTPLYQVCGFDGGKWGNARWEARGSPPAFF